jgi:hypothetical protein
MQTIDLQGPQGNAYALLGIAKSLSKQLRFPMDKAEGIVVDMMQGSYNDLLTVFEHNFGEYVQLINKPGEEC